MRNPSTNRVAIVGIHFGMVMCAPSMATRSTVTSLSDDALLAHVGNLAARERQVTVDLIAALDELDARRLYLGAGYSSLFMYCTQALHLSEQAAYDRIAAARCGRRFPQVVERLADGRLTLTAVCLLRPVMTAENVDTLLNRATHQSKRAVEHLVAEIRPQPAVSTSVRKLPAPRATVPGAAIALTADAVEAKEHALNTVALSAEDPQEPIHLTTQTSTRPAAIKPLTPDTYKVQFTLSSHGYQDLCRAQDLLRHTIPNGDAGVILERALALLVEQLEKTKLAAAKRPRLPRESQNPGGGHARRMAARPRPMRVRRDARPVPRARLARVPPCHPIADGGVATAGNIQLRCRAHNQHEADLWNGADIVKNRPPGYASK